MIELSCLCGDVRLTLGRRPDYLHACNCTLCVATGAHWGYVDPADLRVTGETQRFVRTDKAEAGAETHFCPRCGTTTHFRLVPAVVARFGDTMAGVNMRLADETALAGMEVRYPDGRRWSGEGPFGYVREATVIGGTEP